MKSLARPSFFRMFDLLVSAVNPGLKLTRWTHDGVNFERERHSFTGPRHSVTIDIFTLTRGGCHGWSLMVTKEYWWAGAEGSRIRGGLVRSAASVASCLHGCGNRKQLSIPHLSQTCPPKSRRAIHSMMK
jgi:hypothetical protein